MISTKEVYVMLGNESPWDPFTPPIPKLKSDKALAKSEEERMTFGGHFTEINSVASKGAQLR
jgi:hypothetical protein